MYKITESTKSCIIRWVESILCCNCRILFNFCLSNILINRLNHSSCLYKQALISGMSPQKAEDILSVYPAKGSREDRLPESDTAIKHVQPIICVTIKQALITTICLYTNRHSNTHKHQ